MSTQEITLSTKVVMSLRDVRLHYSGQRSLWRQTRKEVLQGINLDIRSGETLGIIGRNGAGKSSLLKILAGVLPPDGGQVIRHRQDFKVTLLTLQLGFQSNLTGRENATLGCLLAGLSRRESEQLLPQIIEFSGLSTVIEDPLNSYSSGMRARLGFSVAYFTQADMVLIDEVLGVGDHEFKLKSREAILNAIHSDRTVVLVSHDENLMADLCDSLIWIEGGRCILHGPVSKVLETYHDYDHLVNELSRNLGITTEEFRAHPDNTDPVAHLESFRENLRLERNKAIRATQTREDAAVKHFFPGGRDTASNLLMEECGIMVWVENLHEVARGEEQQVRALYQQFEEILLTTSRLSKTKARDMRSTLLSRQMVDTLHKVASINAKHT